LIYGFYLKIGKFANAEGGRIPSDRDQVTVEKLEPVGSDAKMLFG